MYAKAFGTQVPSKSHLRLERPVPGHAFACIGNEIHPEALSIAVGDAGSIPPARNVFDESLLRPLAG
jgi:hypothetical protein